MTKYTDMLQAGHLWYYNQGYMAHKTPSLPIHTTVLRYAQVLFDPRDVRPYVQREGRLAGYYCVAITTKRKTECPACGEIHGRLVCPTCKGKKTHESTKTVHP